MNITVAGAGMIVHDQVLPSLYQLQRMGVIGSIAICSQRAASLDALRTSAILQRAFPGQTFTGHCRPETYSDVIARLPKRSLVFVALPDQLHYHAVMTALRADQHVIVVKPLVLTVAEAAEIEREAQARGLFAGIEYHKRFDDRSLMARRKYREGSFGEFRLGTACLMEKWYYRHSNFQNWCTTDNSDAFTYIGCHYVDLVHFITGLHPTAVSVYGIRDRYPNGKEGWLWTDARVLWSNGACLNVQNSLSFPDAGPGTNTQGLTLYCSDGERGAMLRHSDQYRGLEYAYTQPAEGPGATQYAEPSPDYFQYVHTGGKGLTPVGYGYRSIEHLLRAAQMVENAADRAAELRGIDEEGILATPANSRHNEQVIQAARESIGRDGAQIPIQ